VSGVPLMADIVSASGARAAIPAFVNALVEASLVPQTSAEPITGVPAVSGAGAVLSSRLMLTDVALLTEQPIRVIVTADGKTNCTRPESPATGSINVIDLASGPLACFHVSAAVQTYRFLPAAASVLKNIAPVVQVAGSVVPDATGFVDAAPDASQLPVIARSPLISVCPDASPAAMTMATMLLFI